MAYGRGPQMTDAEARMLAEVLLSKYGPVYYGDWKKHTLALMNLEQEMGKKLGVADFHTVMTAFMALLDQ